MKMKRKKYALSYILCMVLIVAMALVTTGCNGNAGNRNGSTPENRTERAEGKAAAEEAADTERVTVLGEGSKSFAFSVIDLAGEETRFEIHTEEETVGAALLAVGLISGDDGPYGLYVKEVNGITADFNKDKTYWAFYENDEYGMAGVDMTEIEEDVKYSFRLAK